mmetsp:Transcript_156539/g.502400  ORF Transcript_156539/g.502400 Transcript_156539/m.502400 type:complete len:91 (+) Transcript_156539:323-595(+)
MPPPETLLQTPMPQAQGRAQIASSHTACEGKGWASSSGSCCRELADPAPELPPCADLHAELRVDGVQQPGHMRDAAELRGVCEQGVDATA